MFMESDLLLDLMNSRTSIRKYTDEEIKREDLGKILEAGRWAPSAGNMQSWEFVVVEDDGLKEELSQASYNQTHVREAPVCIVVLGDHEKAERKYNERGRNVYMVQETAAAMQNMLLMAQSLDIGTAWVGAFDGEKVSDLLEVPDRLTPLAIVTLGHPNERPIQNQKKRITDVTYINTYGNRLHRVFEERDWEGVANYFSKAKKSIKEYFK